MTPTVAIIGAGMAGLAAALRLGREGVDVQVFEANDKVGGCCATTCIDGYRFNDGAVSLAMPQMLDRLFEALGLDRGRLLPLRTISALQSVTLPDGTIVDITDAPAIALHCAQGTRADSRANEELRDFLNQWEPTLRFFADDILLHPLSVTHLLAKGWRHLARLRGSVASHLDRSFGSEAVRAALGGALLYAGAAPDRLPAALLLGLVSMLRDGFALPQGGMGRITEVLADAVRAQGGRIHLNSPVRRIVVRNGRACAVDVASAGVVPAAAVISGVSAMHTWDTLLAAQDVPSRMARRVRRSPLSHRGFALQLGLANRVKARSFTNCVLPWLGEQRQVFESGSGALRWSTYTVPTATLPELAPHGCSIIEMYPSIGQELAPGDWSEARKEEVAAQAIDGLRRDHEIDIAVRRILSPREFQDGAHLYGGALYGLSPVAGPAALFKDRTPIRGLYQAGQTTWPGFGVVSAGLSGMFAAGTVLRDRLH